jgi:hypothetical protein
MQLAQFQKSLLQSESARSVVGVVCMAMLVVACNSDLPVSATTDVSPRGIRVTLTRVATHPFLARYNLKVTVTTRTGCSADSELFPDTGAVSRRNLYRASSGRLFVVGQFDVRRFDEPSCLVELIEFQSLETGMTFLGAFDVDSVGNWVFIPVGERAEQLFEKL